MILVPTAQVGRALCSPTALLCPAWHPVLLQTALVQLWWSSGVGYEEGVLHGETQNGLPGEVAVSTPWLEVSKSGLVGAVVAWAHNRALGQGPCHPQHLWARLVWRWCCSALKGCG